MLVSSGFVPYRLVTVNLQTFFHMLWMQPPSAAEEDFRHIPATLEDVSNVQDFQESTTNTAASRHGTHEIQIGRGSEGPKKDDRYDGHFAVRHKCWCANRKVELRNILRSMEGTIGSDTNEDRCLRQGNTHNTLEGDELGTSFGPLEISCDTSGERDDAGDTDGSRDGLDDSNCQ